MSAFTEDERKNFLLKKHIKNHLFEYILQIAVNIGFACFIVYISGGSRYLLCIALAAVYSVIRLLFDLQSYKKYWLNGDKKEQNL